MWWWGGVGWGGEVAFQVWWLWKVDVGTANEGPFLGGLVGGGGGPGADGAALRWTARVQQCVQVARLGGCDDVCLPACPACLPALPGRPLTTPLLWRAPSAGTWA